MGVPTDTKRVSAAIWTERLLRSTYRFVQIPSPTGDERAFSEAYAEHLRAIGVLATSSIPLDNRPQPHPDRLRVGRQSAHGTVWILRDARGQGADSHLRSCDPLRLVPAC